MLSENSQIIKIYFKLNEFWEKWEILMKTRNEEKY